MRLADYRIEIVLVNGLWFAEIHDEDGSLIYRGEGLKTRGLAHADACLWIIQH